MVQISIRRVDPELPLPSYAHPGDAGADLHSAVDLTLEPGERALVPTGIAMALPEGYVALVHPRSGLAARHGISIVNAPGTIDAGYRGEVKVCLVNTDRHEPFAVRRGDRIAQLVIQRFETASFVEADDLSESARGDGGYGSTGGFSQPLPCDTPAGTDTGPQRSNQTTTHTASQTPEEIRAGGTTT
jgi:dUTP pyrophosphatase